MTEPRDEPKVEPQPDGRIKWTFTTKDRAVQDDQFSTWCGWFGFDENEKPVETGEDWWLFAVSK